MLLQDQSGTVFSSGFGAMVVQASRIRLTFVSSKDSFVQSIFDTDGAKVVLPDQKKVTVTAAPFTKQKIAGNKGTQELIKFGQFVAIVALEKAHALFIARTAKNSQSKSTLTAFSHTQDHKR